MIIPPKFTVIASEVAMAHGVTLDELREKHRNPSLVAIRREVALALRAAGASYQECGRVMHRDHTSIMNLVKGKEVSQVKVRVA